MKKIILLLTAFIAVSATAQVPESIQKKLDKSNAAIADAKKSTLPATWLDRANIYFEAANAYTGKIVQGITIETAQAMVGKPLSSEPLDISGTAYVKNDFADFVIYTTADKNIIQFWTTKKVDELKELDNSVESLAKMKSLSEKDFNSKGVALCDKLTAQFSQSGRTYYSLSDPAKAADFFVGASKSSELSGKVDTLAFYYAGIAYTDAKEWDKAQAAFEKVLTYGTDEDGMVYIYLSTCAEGKKDMTNAVKVLETGFEKNPNNANILSALINVYLKNDIDPQKLISIIQKAESLDPKNASLYLVEGTVWDKLNDNEKAEAAFAKSLELDSKNFNTYFNLGLVRARRGDAVVEKANKLDLNDVQGYNKLVDEATAIYDSAISALEKAFELNSTDKNTIEMLRTLYFIKRDQSPEFGAKYEKFDALHQQNK